MEKEPSEASTLPEDMLSNFELVGVVRVPKDFNHKLLRKVNWDELSDSQVSFNCDKYIFELSQHKLQNAFRLNLVDSKKKTVHRLKDEAKMFRVIKKPNMNFENS